jgi:cellulose synthase/poly-beta-1,6-N-acetylglucosamine synthase-like glycosyltransferase
MLIVLAIFIQSFWFYFLSYLIYSFRYSPKLDEVFSKIKHNNNKGNTTTNTLPTISIIIPARNEEMYISKCIDSLINQDYSGSLEIIAVNDCSTINRLEIIHTCYSSLQNYKPENTSLTKSKSNLPFKTIDIKVKSEGWTGKNWACYQGYLNSIGQLLLFIDADTIMTSPSTLSLAAKQLLRFNLSAITMMPHLVYDNSIWLKITMPIIGTIFHITYSALKINDLKKSKNGFVFGCFYLITREVYEKIGTHKAVKNEISVDLEIGKLIKERGIIKDDIKIENKKEKNLGITFLKLKMVLGERYLDSVL